MNIELNGQSWEVPLEYQEKLILQLWDMGMTEYAKVPQTYRLLAKPVARKMLYDMEKSLTDTHGKEIAAQVCRPAKNTDPTKHLLWIMTGVIREGIKNATLCIDTEGSADTISAFSISLPRQGESGGPMAIDGNERIGEDYSGENAGPEIRAIIPYE